VFVHPDPNVGWQEIGPHMLVDAMAYADWNSGSGRQTVSLSQGRTVEAMQAEQGSYRVVNVAEAMQLVKRWGRVSLHPLCGGCPPDLAWRYLRRVVDDVIPAVAASSAE
jgi:hypothetical protein